MLLTTWQIIKLIIWGIILINEIAALYTVFREKRDIAATWAWLLVFDPDSGAGLYPICIFRTQAAPGQDGTDSVANGTGTERGLRRAEKAVFGYAAA